MFTSLMSLMFYLQNSLTTSFCLHVFVVGWNDHSYFLTLPTVEKKTFTLSVLRIFFVYYKFLILFADTISTIMKVFFLNGDSFYKLSHVGVC